MAHLLLGKELGDDKLASAVNSIIGAGSQLLFVDCQSPLALFKLNVDFLLKAMAELFGPEAKRFDSVTKTRTFQCTLLSIVENQQVWHTRHAYLSTVSVTRLHMCQARMVGIDVRTLFLAHVFLHGALAYKGWSVIGQAYLPETCGNDKDTSAVPSTRLRDMSTVVHSGELVDTRTVAARAPDSPLMELLHDALGDDGTDEEEEAAATPSLAAAAAAATAVATVTAGAPLSATAAPSANGGGKNSKKKRAAAAAAAASEAAASKSKRPTVASLHAYMSTLSTLTSRIDPLVHTALLSLESPLFGYWLQSPLSQAMLEANKTEAHNVTTRSVAGDLWLVRADTALARLNQEVATQRDSTIHSIALTRLPLAVQVHCNDLGKFVFDLIERTERIAEETGDQVF